MKSICSFEMRHDFKLSLKQLLPLGMFSLVVFMVLIPVSTAAVSDMSIFNVDYTHQQLKFRFAAEEIVLWVGTAAFILGAAAGLSQFFFVTDKKKSAFYFSLGISRTGLYTTRIMAALLTGAVAVILPMGVSLFLNYRALGGYQGIVSYFAVSCMMLFLQFAAGLILFAAGCFLAGTPGEAVICGATLSVAPSAALYFINSMLKTFMWGNVYGAYTYSMQEVRPGLLTLMSRANPICFSNAYLGKYNSFSREMAVSEPEAVDWRAAVGWTVVLIISGIIVCGLLKMYKAEKSGISGLFPFTEKLITAVWPIAVLSLGLNYFSGINRNAAVFAGIFCMSLLYIMLVQTAVMKKCSIKYKLCGLFALFVAVGIFATASLTGGLGILTRIPDLSEVDSVEVSYVGQAAFIPAQCNITTDGASLYFRGNVNLDSEENVRMVSEIDRMMQKQGMKEFESDDGDFNNTVVPYDIEVKYNLENGKTVCRYYDRITAGNLAEFLKLGDSEELKADMGSVIKGGLSGALWNSQTFAEGEIYAADKWYQSVKKINLSGDYRQRMLSAIAEDINGMSSEELYHGNSVEVGELLFTLNGEADTESFMSGSASEVIYITDKYENTLALLNEWGVSMASDSDTPELESVAIQRFDPYQSMNKVSSPVSMLFSSYISGSAEDFVLMQDFGNRPVITEQGQMSEIMNGCRNQYFMNDGGYLLSFKIKGSSSYVYKFLPYGSAPEFINSKFGSS